MEYALIQMYPYALTNAALNWHPMKQLPAFLGGLQQELEGEASRAKQENLADVRRDLLSDVQPERLKRALDAIIAYNDAAAEPSLRWHINEEIVCDLLGGQPSNEKRYLVRRYLAGRRDEITAHHQKHRLAWEQNRKLMCIAEYVKIEPEASGKPPVES